MTTLRPRIYLAGPTIFMPDRDERGRRLKAACFAAGCDGLWPLDIAFGQYPNARAIFRGCLEMLQKADAVVADLSPFRGPHVDGGPHVDDGTAVEIGFAVARGIPVFGYATDLRPLAERIPPRTAGEAVDADGIAIETLGEPFNAMIAGALERPAFRTAADAIAAVRPYLEGVARAERWVGERYAPKSAPARDSIIDRARAAVRKRHKLTSPLPDQPYVLSAGSGLSRAAAPGWPGAAGTSRRLQ